MQKLMSNDHRNVDNAPSLSMIDRKENLGREIFLQDYGRPGKPVVITKLMKNWQARTSWSREFFKTRYGAIPVTVSRYNKSDQRVMRLEDYLDSLDNPREEPPYYLEEWVFEKDCPELVEDYTLPCYFKSWTTWLPEPLRPRWRWLYIGPANSRSPLHVDELCTCAWNALLFGRKRWLFFPPEQTRYLYGGKVDVFNPDWEKYPLFAEAKPQSCVQYPGEIVFTPSDWWHAVVNEEASLALTENFINRINYQHYLNLPHLIQSMIIYLRDPTTHLWK